MGYLLCKNLWLEQSKGMLPVDIFVPTNPFYGDQIWSH